MAKKILLLIIMSFSLAVGGFWALKAQDPAPQNPATVRTDPPTVSAQTVQTDLSGTYTGTFNCDALGLTGDTTLTITGNEFTTADGKTGRIVASTTGGYTAVALQVGGVGTAGTTATATTAVPPPTIVSLRARKSGNRLTLTSVPGSGQRCTFTTARVARGRRNQQTPAATGTEVANPAATPSPAESPTESPMPSQTPSPSPTATPEPTPEPSPEPSPEPMPSPTPSGSPTPMPSPTPSGSPTPIPSPTPTPSPTEPAPSPSPSPSPSPGPIR